MAKPSSRSTLYRLIEAGQLAHQALLQPLVERGREPGDDAILFALNRTGMTDAALAEELLGAVDCFPPARQYSARASDEYA